MTTCPEIASQTDSDIELSTYERTNGTTVVIGCKGIGRHISGPPLVACLENGTWSETPNLKCEFGLDLKEKIFVGIAAVSIALALLTVIAICCRRRRRRRYYHHRYNDWRDSDNSLKDWGSGVRGRWSAWTSKWFSRPGDDKGYKSSSHYHEYTSGPSKSFVNEFGYSRGERDKSNSFSKKSGLFRSSRRFSDGDKYSVDKEMFSKKYSGEHSAEDKHSVHRQEFSKKSNFLQNSGRYSDIDRRSLDKLAASKKSDFLKQSGKSSDMDKHSFIKRSNFMRQSGWYSDRNMYSDRNKFSDDRFEGRRKGWRGWTDSLRENWIDWRSRTFGDSPADGSVRRHDRFDDSSYPERGFREKYSKYYRENRTDMMGSRRQSNDDMSRDDDFRRGRRYSDSSMVAQRERYTKREASYGSRLEDDVQYNRVRRYSDPMIYRSEFSPYRHDMSRDSRYVSADQKPSFNILRYDDSRHHLMERQPATFEHTKKPVIQYSGAETERYLGTAQILDPLYYHDPHYYIAGSRNSGVLQTGDKYYSGGAIRYNGGTGKILDGQARFSEGKFVDGRKLRYTTGHVTTDGLPRLPPISLDQLAEMVNLNGLDRSYGTRVVSSPRIIELDDNKHVTSRIVGNDLGRTHTGHFEMMTANPSAGSFEGIREIPIDNSTRSGGHYTLYQGKGRTKQLQNL